VVRGLDLPLSEGLDLERRLALELRLMRQLEAEEETKL